MKRITIKTTINLCGKSATSFQLGIVVYNHSLSDIILKTALDFFNRAFTIIMCKVF